MVSKFSTLASDDIIKDCYSLLEKSSSNIVLAVLSTEEKFYEWEHYPDSDVYDTDSHSQYYYHTHPQESDRGWPEHGHFHLFLRKKGIPDHLKPVLQTDVADDLCHLIAISMDAYGKPICLFTCNRWVTGETWYDAKSVAEMVDHFIIDQAWPSLSVNLWMTAIVKKYKDEIIKLLYERDAKIKEWQQQRPQQDVFEDRELEVMSKFNLVEAGK